MPRDTLPPLPDDPRAGPGGATTPFGPAVRRARPGAARPGAAILVLNAGSSSLKFSLFAHEGGAFRVVVRGEVDGLDGQPRFEARDGAGVALPGPEPVESRPEQPHEAALHAVLGWLDKHGGQDPLSAAGHRVVHGGEDHGDPSLVTPALLEALGALVPLAPLHQPHNLAAIRALAALRPGLPQVACFDTAFHRTQPPVARTFALPRDLTGAGIRRYGFHGLSYESVAQALPGLLDGRADGRVVVAHLGHGASLCAMRARRSVATTMSFTALDGVPMSTRCGAIDPGVLLHLLTSRGMSADALTDLLYNRSGLLGVSGVSGDMRELLASPAPEAAEAIELFTYRVAREVGSLAAALEGLDALVFTGGIGEHAAPIRARVCQQAAWLGVRLDEAANARGGPCITRPDSLVPAWVVATDEERVIAAHTARVLALSASGAGGPRPAREGSR
jgi:acetate kinase